MDMATKFHEQTVFLLIGKRPSGALEALDSERLRPALLAAYRDLTRLRYDYPLVLVDGATDRACLQTLSEIVDAVLKEVAPRGIEGERLRKHVLRLEREIRVLASQGTTGRLSEFWPMAAARIGTQAGDALVQVLGYTGGALKHDGEVIDCDRAAPARVLGHAWRAVQAIKAERFRAETGRLARKLSDILRAAYFRSEAGRRPDSLKAGFGGAYRETFDFDAMSRLVGRSAPAEHLPQSRRRRIEWALAALERQRFYPPPGGIEREAHPVHGFQFADCASAIQAFESRLPEAAELVKAMSIANLEIEGRYAESKHDPLFEEFGEESLGAEDLALFPDYLVCIEPGRADAPENAALMQVLASELPIKVLVQTEDALEGLSLDGRRIGGGARSGQLASAALGAGNAFVLQTTSSNLYPLAERLLAGLAYAGPALFSVYCGANETQGALPRYLSAAAALDARAYPAFVYDPAAGTDWASRFSLEGNPQPELDWPVWRFDHADEALQRVTEEVAFTVLDFAACDRRYARHFARMPQDAWNADMIPAGDWLARDVGERDDRVPCVLVVDDDDVLQKLVVDAKLVQAARRCRDAWRRLQELGGIHNSHAQRLLAREKAAWEGERRRELESVRGEAASAQKPAAGEPSGTTRPQRAEPAPEAAVAQQRPSGEPWVETARCTTCNECQLINDRMFVYNENKQAFIKDRAAGTYRELVEAAEACQVAIIHPGLPRDPNEPGAEELVKRAEAFS
jgi:hypothetical protein